LNIRLLPPPRNNSIYWKRIRDLSSASDLYSRSAFCHWLFQ
jgi:hypothetical protein